MYKSIACRRQRDGCLDGSQEHLNSVNIDRLVNIYRLVRGDVKIGCNSLRALIHPMFRVQGQVPAFHAEGIYIDAEGIYKLSLEIILSVLH